MNLTAYIGLFKQGPPRDRASLDMYPHPVTASIGKTYPHTESTCGSQASDVISWPPTPSREQPIGRPTLEMETQPRMDRLLLIQTILKEVHHPPIVQHVRDRENQPRMDRAARISSILAKGHHMEVPSNVASHRCNMKRQNVDSRLEVIQHVLAHQDLQ